MTLISLHHFSSIIICVLIQYSRLAPLQQPLHKVILYNPQQRGRFTQQSMKSGIRFECFIFGRRLFHQLFGFGIIHHHVLLGYHAQKGNRYFMKGLLYLSCEFDTCECRLWTHVSLIRERIPLTLRSPLRVPILHTRIRRRARNHRHRRNNRIQPPKSPSRGRTNAQR